MKEIFGSTENENKHCNKQIGNRLYTSIKLLVQCFSYTYESGTLFRSATIYWKRLNVDLKEKSPLSWTPLY